MPQGNLAVISRAKDLCGYVLQATDASPKRFRFTLVSRLQNYALDVVDRLFRANEVFVAAGDEQAAIKETSITEGTGSYCSRVGHKPRKPITGGGLSIGVTAFDCR